MQPAASVGPTSLNDMPSAYPAAVKSAQSSHLVGQRSYFLDPDLDHVAGLEEFPARRADSGRCARENHVAGVKRHATRQSLDLLGQVEDHVVAVGSLPEHVVYPELETQVLRGAECDRGQERGVRG